MTSSRRRSGIWILAAIVLFGWSASGAMAQERIIAIGDIHGAYPQLIQVLHRTGLVDDNLHWSGGETILVQVGDMLDRGSQPREVMDLLMRLQDEAPHSGGHVIVLMGNHEAMNIVGDLRYVTPEIYAEFSDRESPRRRKLAWNQWKRLITKMARRHGDRPPAFTSEMEHQFNREHPPGFFKYRQAMGPGGEYGKWLRSLPAAVRLGGTIFVHGGLSPTLPMRGVDDLNEAVAEEIKSFDRDVSTMEHLGVALPSFTLPEMLTLLKRELTMGVRRNTASVSRNHQLLQEIDNRWGDLSSTLIMGSNGPLWFRGFARWSPQEGTPAVDKLCLEWGATRFVVGHSPTGTRGHIVTRFDGRVFLIDTGMLPGHYPGGRPSALEITPSETKAIYLDSEEPPSPWDGEDESASLQRAPEPKLVPRAPATVMDAWMGVGTPDSESANATSEQTPAPSIRVWLGPDGKPLPFKSDAEILHFLRTAEVVGSTGTKVGINATRKLTLKEGDIVAHAVFRTVNEEKLRKDLPTGTVLNFKDSYKSEVAAYELSRLLGMDEVPPAALRTLNHREGSVQLWIEKAEMEVTRLKKRETLPNVRVWLELYDMRVFDNVIGNIDRNQGNILYDQMGRLWLIDHTRSFSRSPKLPDTGNMEKCSLRLWNGLNRLTMAQLEAHLSDSLFKSEMKAVMERRDSVLQILNDEIRKRGRDAVLFDLDRDAGSVDVLPSEPIAPASPVPPPEAPAPPAPQSR